MHALVAAGAAADGYAVGLGLLLAELGVLLERALSPRVADVAPLAVAGVVLEAPEAALPVDLRDVVIRAMFDDVDVSLLAALELDNDAVDQSLSDELFQSVAGTRGYGGPPRGWGAR